MRSFLIYFSIFCVIVAVSFGVASKCLPEEKIVLTADNMVLIKGEIGVISMIKATKEVLALRAKNANSKIYLVMNSPGGEIDAGLAFIKFLKTQKNITTISIFAASMASGIVEALPERLITKDGTLMFHRAHVGLEGYINNGELEVRLAYIKKTVQVLEDINRARFGISLEAYRQLVQNEYWLFGQEAIEKKAADRVVDISCDQALIDARNEVTVQTLFGAKTIVYSACPIIELPVDVK